MSPERPVEEGGGRVRVSVATWSLMAGLLNVVRVIRLDILTFAAACCPVGSNLGYTFSCTAIECTLTARSSQTRHRVARQRASGINGPEC